MALDKQQILSELGSVMNKLQSADCGCMGNIFSKGQHTNQVSQGGANMSALPTCGGCRRGCCHGHGYGGYGHGYSAGEPCANSYIGAQCNPPKLYADTYSYLNSNLMQPIVNEVYQDLKSLNETNTIVNNPLGSNMLNQQRGAAVQGMPPQGQMPGNMAGNIQNPNMANQQMGNQHMSNQQVEQMIGGMGPNIVSMMNSSVPGKTGQNTAPMATGQPVGQPSGDMNEGMNMNNGARYGGQQGQSTYMQHQSMSNAISPNNPNAVGGKMQQNYGQATPSYKVNYTNPGAQQMASHVTEQKYGQHTPGMSKFNEMFPGVMGGDLGFDPMALAIQMNPANQQQAAVGAMQKIMNGNPIERAMDTKVMQQAIPGANAAYNQSLQNQQINPISNLQPAQPGMPGSHSNVVGNELQRQVHIPQQQQQTYTALTGAPALTMSQNQPPQQYQQQLIQQNQKQPTQLIQQQPVQQYQQQPAQQYQQQPAQQYQQQPAQQYQQQPAQQYQQQPAQQYQQQPAQQYQQQPAQQYQQQPAEQYQQQPNQQSQQQPTQQYQQQPAQQYNQYLDPIEAQSIAAPNLPTMYEGKMSQSNVPPQSYSAPSPGQTIKDPIFPVVSSRYQPPNIKHHRSFEYNTLGQPVELLPAKMYHTPPPTSQQQTLSPQPVTNQPRFAVKNTVSKTSIMGNRPVGTVGRAPSRGQLQQIYNQYKGSQSYTRQNITPSHGITYSEGKINVNTANGGQNRHVPVERVGGDTLANNQMVYQQVPVKAQPLGHSGDVPMPVDNKPHGDMVPTKEFPDKRCRNGLQDVVHTSYHTSKAPSWSFHGNNIRPAYPPAYRTRGRG